MTEDGTSGWEARCLLRAARSGTLATVTAEGQPFASLITPATAPDLSILLLLSALSEHTRHLKADPRCAVMVAGPPEGANPQNAPRLTVTGTAEMIDDLGLKERWVMLHPYAAFYADFDDFSIWRVRPMGALYVAGFARAMRLRQAVLLPDAEAIATVAEAERDIMQHCNDDHADALTRIAHRAGHRGHGWQMIAVDVDGFDLLQDEHPVRIAWSAPVSSPAGVREELIRLARG
ncbi:MAG TPA: DUF2470 domain-containing protein [Acetobacteraceae bacterium]|nr:DUF2470 domain-containing protein [Acetobacteraceae bacterium]